MNGPSFTARGTAGSLRAGGREAAALGAWTLTTHGGGEWRAEATVLRRDAYWLTSGHPLTLLLTLGTRTWRFSPMDAQTAIDGDTATITGTLPPEES